LRSRVDWYPPRERLVRRAAGGSSPACSRRVCPVAKLDAQAVSLRPPVDWYPPRERLVRLAGGSSSPACSSWVWLVAKLGAQAIG
jgi:hypothetical protein